MRKLTTIIALAILFSATAAFGQERPFRIGLKFGYPQLAGLNLEYVTPALSERLSADVDLSYFGLDVDGASASYTFLYFGANYYFFNEGRGLYGGLGFGRQAFSASFKVNNPYVTTESVNADASVGLNNLYLKLGGKHGGLFYFRWNLGYGLSLVKEDFKYSASFVDPSNSANTTTVSKSEEVPLSGGFMLDLGFGFSF